MAKPTKTKATKKNPIEQYDHKGKKRVNNPPVGLFTAATDKESSKKTYAYDPHLDPQLVWAGKAERSSSLLFLQPISQHRGNAGYE